MKKRFLLFMLVFSALTTIIFLKGAFAADYSNANKITYGNLYNQVIANEGSAVVMKDMEVNMLQGDVYGEIKGFDSYTSTIITDQGGINQTGVVGYNSWRIKASYDSAAIFEIKATNDIKLNISHIASKSDGDFLGNPASGSYLAVYYKTNNEVYELWKSEEITASNIKADQYGGDVMLKAGDICYFTFSFETTGTGHRIISTIPTFTSDTASYSEADRLNQIPAIDQSIDIKTAVNNYKTNHATVGYTLFSLGFYYGSMDSMTAFGSTQSNNNGLFYDTSKQGQSTGIRPNQIQCSGNMGGSAIMKITSNVNSEIQINHDAPATVWAKHSAVRYYVESANGTRILLQNIPVIDGMTEDYFGITVHLRTGESLYMEYYSTTSSYGVVDFKPTVNASNSSYDAAKSFDFDTELLKQLFAKYYNNGVYTKQTEINIDSTSEILEKEIAKFFHAGVTTLSRTTYYNGDALWMSRGNGKYSYYGTAYDGTTAVGVTNATTNEALVAPENASIVLSGEGKSSMEEYYYTLYDLVNLEYKSGLWSCTNGIYTSTDAYLIELFKNFTAPCFLNFDSNNENYLEFSKVTVEVNGENLVLKLYVSSGDSGKLVAEHQTDLVFSSAVITL